MAELYAGKFRAIADWLGMLASTACAVHCVLLPTLLITGAVLPTSLLGDEAFHQGLLWVILPAAILAFGIGCWRHKDRWVLVLGLIGLTGIVLAVVIVHDIAGEAGERIVTVLSAAILVTAHYRNYQLCRTSACDHHAS